ncbi:MAG: tandem-95 repeat protein, partial [Planctomycetales bacterium]|nr:tandem-95 repeat protein [Planctomycetales bacterium]
TITVTPVNDAPIANADSVNAVEDTPLTINTADLVANDLPGPASAADEAGQTLVIQAASYAGNNGSTLLVSPDGSTITYQAGPNFNGVETFTYTLWDGFGDPSNPQNLAVGVVSVTVAEANDPPVAIGDSRNTQEDVPVTITASLLTANDRPGPTNEPAATVHKEASQTMQVVGVGATSGRGGSVTFDTSTGLIVYTPPANFNNGSGVDTFTYIVEDNGTSSGTDSFQRATGTVTMTITPVNDNPIPVNDNVSTNEDTALTILEGDILANDAAGPADETGQALVITSVASASDNGGTITRAGATILYTPPANFNGIDRFTYVVQDNGTTNNLPDARSATGTIVVSIAPVNDPPFVANQPASVNATEDPTVTPIVVNLAGVFGDPDIALNNDTLTLTVNGNSRPSLVTAAITGTTLSLTPQLNQNGTAVISILATDSSGAGVTASINVNITAVNDDPVLANPIADFTVGEDAPNTTIELFPTVFDDPDVHTNNDQLTIRVLTNNNPSLVSATMSGTILTLDYADNQSGSATIVLEARDLAGRTVTDSFVVTVQAINDAPTAVADTYTVVRGQPLNINDPNNSDGNPFNNGLLVNDTDPENNPLTVQLVSNVLNGNLVLNANGTFTYTHNGGSTTQDSFSYRVSDGANISNVATVTLSITNPFQNTSNRFDVNNDGEVSPIDALLVINHINRLGSGSLPPGFIPPPFVDVSGDGEVSPQDVNAVITELNRLAALGTGEGEATILVSAGEGINTSAPAFDTFVADPSIAAATIQQVALADSPSLGGRLNSAMEGSMGPRQLTSVVEASWRHDPSPWDVVAYESRRTAGGIATEDALADFAREIGELSNDDASDLALTDWLDSSDDEFGPRQIG